MSIHSSLKTQSGALNQHRNVLTRAERIAKLTLESGFDPKSRSALNLVKVRSIKAVAGKKAAKKADEVGADGKPVAAAATAGAKPAAAGGKPAAAAAAKPAAKKK